MQAGAISLSIRAELCTFCRACELACSFVKEGVYSPALSRIQVVHDYTTGISVPIACVNCADAPCIEVCPSEAITRNEQGIVHLDQSLCSACEACVEACPYGAVFVPYGCGVTVMCDLCGGDPACVSSCIYGALRFERQPDALLSTLELQEQAGAESKRWAVAKAIAARIRKAREVRA